MDPRRRMVLYLFGAIAVFNLALRWPVLPHKIGLDSFVMLNLTNSIVANGMASYTLTLFSYFGLYPLSYPSAAMFLLAAISQVTGIAPTNVALIVSIFLGQVGMIGMFLLAREIWANSWFALTAAILYAMAPRFVLFTLWNVPTRTLYMAIAPFFLLYMFRFHRRTDVKNSVILVLLLILLMASHRMASILLLVFAAYYLTFTVLFLVRMWRLLYPRMAYSTKVQTWMPYTATAGVVVFGIAFAIYGTFFGGVFTSYEYGIIVSGTGWVIPLFNLGVSLARSVGFLLPLVLLGMLELVFRPNKGFKEPFLVIIALVLIPTLGLRFYAGFFLLPFLVIFIALGLAFLVLRLPAFKREMKIAVVILLALSFASSLMVLGVELNLNQPMSDDSYATGLYVRDLGGGTMLGNNGARISRVASVAGVPYLPVGGATTVYEGPELLENGFFEAEELEIVPVVLTEITVQSDSPFVLRGVNTENDYVNLIKSQVSTMAWEPGFRDLQNRYSVTTLLVDNQLGGHFVAYGNTYYAPIIVDAEYYSIRVYLSDEYSIYLGIGT